MNKKYRLQSKKGVHIYCLHLSKEKKKKSSSLFPLLADIQECYEVTLQLNKEHAVAKEDSRQDAWEVIFFFLLHIIDW